MFSRRTTLTVLSLLVVLAMLAACAPPTPEKVVETVVVTKEVPVEVTKIVEKPVEVTKIIEKPVEVTKIVEVTPPPKVTITIAYNQYFNTTFSDAPTPLEALRAEVAKKYPNIEVVLNMQPTEVGHMHDNYLTWFMAKDGTTDLLGVCGYWTSEFGEAGWLIPLNDGVPPDVNPKIVEKLNPAYLEAHTYQGKLLGLGPWWGGIGGLYYRKDLLEEYGFKPPETYDDVVEISEAILKDHPELTGWTWPAMKDPVLVNRWSEYLHGFGGTYFDEEGKCAMNSPEAVAALEFMVNLIKKGISPPEITSWKEEDSMVRFVSGKAIFHTGRQDMLFWLDNPEKSKIVGKWGFIPNPAQPGGRHSGFYEGWAFGINKYSDNPEEALKVLEVMFDFPVQKLFCLSQGPVQAHVDLYADPDVQEYNPNIPLIEEVAKTALGPLPSPHYSEIADILMEEIHGALTGLKAPKAALDDACARIDEVTGH